MVGQITLSIEASTVLPVPKRAVRNGTKAGGPADNGNVIRAATRPSNRHSKAASSGLRSPHLAWARAPHSDRRWAPDPAKPCRSCHRKPEKRHLNRPCPILTLRANFQKEKSLSLLTASKQLCRFFTDVRECAAATWDQLTPGGL